MPEKHALLVVYNGNSQTFPDYSSWIAYRDYLQTLDYKFDDEPRLFTITLSPFVEP